MADINGVTLNAGSDPTVKYTITYTKSRPNNSQMTYSFTISAALSSSGAYIHNGYALLCTMTVNGSSSQVRIKTVDGDNWDGTTPRLRYVTVTCASSSGNAAQGVRFQVVSDGRLTLTSGVIDNSSYTVTSSPLLITASGAPSVCSVSSTLSEGNVTLSWSGASGGTNNAISSYEIQYSDSSNNSTWGSWTALTTVTTTATSGSVSVAPPTTRGNYRRFQVRTRGAAGASYYSGWKISTNSVRKNTPPQPATSISAAPLIYSTEPVILTWSGASGGSSPIKGYMIASQTSVDNATWTAWSVLENFNLSASSGSRVVAATNVSGTYTRYGLWTIDTLDVYSSEAVSNSVLCAVSACTEPTAFAFSATIAEATVTLSWSGALGGAGNAITGYELESSESSDGIAWGDWSAVGVIASTSGSGSLTTAPSTVRGNYLRHRIRVQGTAGSAYFSPWKITTNTVRKNILATPPTTFTASPLIYATPSATLTWDGTVAGTSAIKNYIIQQSTSINNVAWGTWETVTTVVSSATSGTYTATPSNIPGTFTRYRIAVTDTLSAVSSYVISNSIKKNTVPATLTIAAPKNSSATYNANPQYLIQVGADADGEEQTLFVYSTSGVWLNSVDHPEHFGHGGKYNEGERTIFRDSATAPGTFTIRFESHDDYSSSVTVNRTITVLPSPFEEIVPNVTHVKASHILTIRSATNIVRNYYSLAAFNWSKGITAGVTEVRDWVFHILEIRSALNSVIDLVGSFHSETTPFSLADFEWLPLTTGRPKADVMTQIHELILSL